MLSVAASTKAQHAGIPGGTGFRVYGRDENGYEVGSVGQE